MKKNKLISTGLASATAASLCCIGPLISLFAGAGGAITNFSWIEPIRPYLVGFTIIILGYSWYHNLTYSDPIDCDCDVVKKTRFFQSRLFLGLVTVFAILMLALPYYSTYFYPQSDLKINQADVSNIQKTEFIISGMTCSSCEAHINHQIIKLPGIISSTASFTNGNASVAYDSTLTNEKAIEKAINQTGYTVTKKMTQ